MLSVFVALLLLHAVDGYSASGVAPLKSQPAAAVRPPAASGICMAEPHATIIFLRHGQSVWNEASLFTGWADVELTTLGKNEAAAGATAMWKEGIAIDVAFTSLLRRAQQTLDIVMRITGQEDVPVHQNWRLNERMCTPDAPLPYIYLVPLPRHTVSVSVCACRWRPDGPQQKGDGGKIWGGTGEAVAPLVRDAASRDRNRL